MSDKILIVDDEAEIADLIEAYLQNENYTENGSIIYQSSEMLPFAHKLNAARHN